MKDLVRGSKDLDTKDVKETHVSEKKWENETRELNMIRYTRSERNYKII